MTVATCELSSTWSWPFRVGVAPLLSDFRASCGGGSRSGTPGNSFRSSMHPGRYRSSTQRVTAW